jgi:hypothetical protein
MASLFQPEVPQEDPAVAKQRMEEEARAKLAAAAATQDQLQTETRLRSGRFGIRSLLGSFGSGNTPLGSG